MAQMSRALTLPLCATHGWRHRLSPRAQQAAFPGHLMPQGGAQLGSPEAQVTPRGHRREQRGPVGRLQVLLVAEGHDTSARGHPLLQALQAPAILLPPAPAS